MQHRPRLNREEPRASAFGTNAEDHFRALRRNIRREYLTAVSETIGLAAWSERQDRVIDILDRELHNLVSEAGGTVSGQIAPNDPSAEPSDDLESLLAQVPAARGEGDDVRPSIPSRFMPPG